MSNYDPKIVKLKPFYMDVEKIDEEEASDAGIAETINSGLDALAAEPANAMSLSSLDEFPPSSVIIEPIVLMTDEKDDKKYIEIEEEKPKKDYSSEITALNNSLVLKEIEFISLIQEFKQTKSPELRYELINRISESDIEYQEVLDKLNEYLTLSGKPKRTRVTSNKEFREYIDELTVFLDSEKEKGNL